MTSHNRVLAVFAHEEPDRVPCWCGMSDEFREKAKREMNLDDESLLQRFGDDFRRVFARLELPPYEMPSGSISRTVFGVNRHGLGFGQPMTHPLAKADLKAIHDFSI